MTKEEIIKSAIAYADSVFGVDAINYVRNAAEAGFIAGANTAPSKWIPINQEMPKGENPRDYLSEDVLFTDGVNVFAGWYNFKSLYWGTAGRVIHNVTHWMPLPSLPNE